MVVRSSRVCIILLCFAVFICALSRISKGNDSLNGFTPTSERNKANLRNFYQEKPNKPRLATYSPFVNTASRSQLQRHGRTNSFGYINLVSNTKQKLLNFGRRYPLLNHKLHSASTGHVYRNWSKYQPRSDRTLLPRPRYLQAKSYIPLARPRNYYYKMTPLSRTRPADAWHWGQYSAVNAYPRTIGYRITPRYGSFRPWQQRSSVNPPPVAVPLYARYPNHSFRGRIMYPADRVERDSVLNMRSGKVIPWGQEEATARNLHVERPMDKATVPRWVAPSYSNRPVPYGQGAQTSRIRSLGANLAGWNQVPIALNAKINYDKTAYSKGFKSPVPLGQLSNVLQTQPYTQRPFHLLTVSREKVARGFIPRPESSPKLSRLKYVLRKLRKRNARFTTAPASYSKPTTNGKDSLARTRKSKRSSDCFKYTFNTKRFYHLAAKKRSNDRQSSSFRSRRKRGVKKRKDVGINTQNVASRQTNQFEAISRIRLVRDSQEQSQNTRPPRTVYGTDETTQDPVFVPKVELNDDPEVKNVLLIPSAPPGVKIPLALPGLKRYLKNHKN